MSAAISLVWVMGPPRPLLLQTAEQHCCMQVKKLLSSLVLWVFGYSFFVFLPPSLPYLLLFPFLSPAATAAMRCNTAKGVVSSRQLSPETGEQKPVQEKTEGEGLKSTATSGSERKQGRKRRRQSQDEDGVPSSKQNKQEPP